MRRWVVTSALVVAFTGGIGSYLWRTRPHPRATRPLDAVPQDAFVAVDLNVAALRQAGVLTTLFGSGSAQSLTKDCGFDPVDRMDDLVLTVPEGGTGDFGVAVQAALTKDELVHCADARAKDHGASTDADSERYGTYSLLTPRSAEPGGTKTVRSLGFRTGSPILVGPKAWLETMIDSLDAASEGRKTPGEHEALRTSLAEGVNPTFLATATVLLEKSVREKIRAEVTAEVGPGTEAGSAMMLGVLGLTSAGLGVYAEGDQTHVRAKLRCEDESQCIQVLKLFTKMRGEWAKLPAVRLLGLLPVLDHLESDTQGTTITLHASAPTTDVLRGLKVLLSPAP